jgi:hypothetical protein
MRDLHTALIDAVDQRLGEAPMTAGAAGVLVMAAGCQEYRLCNIGKVEILVHGHLHHPVPVLSDRNIVLQCRGVGEVNMRDNNAAGLREGGGLFSALGLAADRRLTRRIEHAAGMTAVQHQGEVDEIRRERESAPANSSISRSEMSPPASAQQIVS